ncbi:Uma2 family endonuclease [Prochlorothrix hollandica]|uniref:Uma2 family endonuclease n=1 Tax=Prochlorothrix hollandica TaxID=1223 RepID=UPI00034DE397|nr:Uma2 family endonuclease [Prochlorothrix hollandica]
MIVAPPPAVAEAPTPPLTAAEYLAQEPQADRKNELIQGTLFPMAGASANHNLLTGKFHARLLLALEDLNYTVFMSDMRLAIPDQATYTYPDVMVIKGEPQFQTPRQTEVLNPCLIIEILSDSTANYDKTAKFQLYRTLPSLEEYILVSQQDYRLEHYTKLDDRRWLLQDITGLEASLQLSSVNLSLSLQDLYKRVSFGPAA